MPRLLRSIWLKLGKKHNRNVAVKGWKSINEETFDIPHPTVPNLSLGMDVSYYLDNKLIALIEAKSNYPMGVEKSILDVHYLKQIQPEIVHMFVTVTTFSTRGNSKDRMNKQLAEAEGLELWSFTNMIRSQFDKRWETKSKIPPTGIVPFIDRVERLLI